jgi:hypothetical protein
MTLKFPSWDDPRLLRHQAQYARLFRAKPGYRAAEARFQPRTRDIDFWRMVKGSGLSRLQRRAVTGCGIEALAHAMPFHLFPLSERLSYQRSRVKVLAE